MTDNVVPFPGMADKVKEKVIDELEKRAHEEKLQKSLAVDETTGALVENLLMQLKMFGMDDPIGSHWEKEMCFAVESMRSLVSKIYYEPHVLQDLAERTIEMNDADHGGTYFFVEPIGLVVPKKEK